MQTSTIQLDGLLRSNTVVPVGSKGAFSTCSGKIICQWKCLSGGLGFIYFYSCDRCQHHGSPYFLGREHDKIIL